MNLIKECLRLQFNSKSRALQFLEHIVPKNLVLRKRLVDIEQMIFEASSASQFLQYELNRRVRLNPRYSLRAFAQTLSLSSGALSEILRDQRPLSLKSATKIAKALGLSSVETNRLYELIDDRKKSILINEIQNSTSSLSKIRQKKLTEDTFHLISEWQHFAILNLLDCEGFKWKASYIAKRLSLTQVQAQMAMNLLIRLGLVYKHGENYKGVEDYVLSPTDISSVAIRKYHRQVLEKAIEAIEFQSVNERDLSGIGFAIDPLRLPQIKKEISVFQDQLIAKYSKGKKQEVYFLEMALFKLTQGEQSE